MVINGVNFNAELGEILAELIQQMRLNQIEYLSRIKETESHIQVQCPYHSNGQERRPSAGIRRADGMFHCFACGAVHTLPEVISYCLGHPDDLLGKYGWEWLLKNFATGSGVSRERKDVRIDLRRDKENSEDVGGSPSNTSFVEEAELDSYRWYHPYWKKRGITDEHIIELFDLGYDKKTDCITFPVRDIKGRCLFVARRSVHTKFFNYPSGAEKPLYGLYELYQSGIDKVTEVIVTESMLDALSFWQIGRYAVALNGLGNDLQFRQLRNLPVRKVILATDMDERGLDARKRIRKNLGNTKIIKEYYFPSGRKDANECSQEELLELKDIF